jgi:3D-(3,5/4)-trihydroxycyclohexane-1,2-dione acylhydrolase (decyclizing)
MGAQATLATNAQELTRALAAAREGAGVHVVVVPVDPSKRLPALGTWWDVPVAAVSADAKTREARAAYEEAIQRQRAVFGSGHG